MGEPEALDAGVTGQFGCFLHQHMSAFDRSRQQSSIAVHPLADQEVRSSHEPRQLWSGSGIGHEGDGDTTSRRAEHEIRGQKLSREFDRFSTLQAMPERDRDTERLRSLWVEPAAPWTVQCIREARDPVPDRQRAQKESTRKFEFAGTGELQCFDRKWESRYDAPQCSDYLRGADRADDTDRFLTIGEGEGVQDTRETSDVIGVEVRQDDRIEIAEAPSGVSPGNLRTLAAIEEDNVPLAADQESG